MRMPLPTAKPFHLVELVLRAGRDLLVAVALAGQDHANRLGAALAHRADLAGLVCVRITSFRCAGSRFVILADPERVPHVAGRVVGRDVQQPEVVVVGFHVRPVVHLEAHLGKDRGTGAGSAW